MSETAIIRAGMPAMELGNAVERYKLLNTFVAQVLRKGIDFGVIPGTGDKPVLLKPGAEKLTTFFGLAPTFEQVRVIEDWTGEAHGGEPFFYYLIKCRLMRNGEVVAEGDGSCNSRESKYRYRQGERICPACGKAAIIKGKADYGGGWLCFGKKGGCGAKYKDGDPAIEGQQVGRILNPDPADQVNTILKQSEKRALVAATLLAVNASDYFTQDMEDLPQYGDIVEGTVRVVQETGTKQSVPNGERTEPPPDPTWDSLVSASEERDAGKPKLAVSDKDEHPAMAAMQLGSQTAQFTTWCAGFVDVFPYYAKNGKADMAHIMRAVAAEKFTAVTPDNLDAVCKALEARAERKVTGN